MIRELTNNYILVGEVRNVSIEDNIVAVVLYEQDSDKEYCLNYSGKTAEWVRRQRFQTGETVLAVCLMHGVEQSFTGKSITRQGVQGGIPLYVGGKVKRIIPFKNSYKAVVEVDRNKTLQIFINTPVAVDQEIVFECVEGTAVCEEYCRRRTLSKCEVCGTKKNTGKLIAVNMY